MVEFPDLLGFNVDVATEMIKSMGYEVIVKESIDKNTEITRNIRVIRQKLLSKNKMEVIISFF